jgi:hypothetical protein
MQAEARLACLLGAVEAEMRRLGAEGALTQDRYARAMIDRALAIARRELEGGIDAPERELNRQTLGRDDPSLDALAGALRARTIGDATDPHLFSHLLRFVRQRALRWNPDLIED